jgi:bifunctional UDP-N-acetylglucosamine pyrophosphorylase/glucosamine-1-phosphate N-acetyltransferase
MRNSLAVVVLAGGLGTRMRSDLPKVLHPLLGRPMLRWVLEAVLPLKPSKTVVVTNPLTDRPIRQALEALKVEYALQRRPLGTANAFLAGYRKLTHHNGPVVVLNGDTPLIRAETLKRFVRRARQGKLALSVLSFEASEPKGYGRIIRDQKGRALGIKEEKDLADSERAIREVNSGVYYITPQAAALVSKIKKNPLKGEYYLTDLLGIAVKRGLPVEVLEMGTEEEFLGINTKEELLRAQRLLRKRIVMELVYNDVVVVDEERVYVGPEVRVGPGTVLFPDVYLEGSTTIGANCTVYPNVRIVDTVIDEEVEVRENSVLEGALVQRGAVIGPFARLRPGTVIKAGAKIGNFVEVKNSTVGEGTKALHLSYLGDATIGRGVNIGAGTITCNYDGIKKHRTIIEDGAFVGSDTQLVAPVKVSRGAYIGAGTTVTKDVPPESLAITRTPQKNIQGWVKRRKREDK